MLNFKHTPIKILDLHMIRHKEAIEMVHQTLKKEKERGSFSITIITGNSTVLQQRIFNEILNESSYSYYIPSWNLGQIVVEYIKL